MLGITKRQNDCLNFINQYREKNDGVSPSYQEIATGLGVASKGNVHHLVHGLIERGAIANATAGRYVKKRSLAPSGPSDRLVKQVATLVGLAEAGFAVTDAMIRDALSAA